MSGLSQNLADGLLSFLRCDLPPAHWVVAGIPVCAAPDIVAIIKQKTKQKRDKFQREGAKVPQTLTSVFSRNLARHRKVSFGSYCSVIFSEVIYLVIVQ